LGDDKIKVYTSNLERRFGKKLSEIENELDIASIFVIFGVTFNSLSFQILSDILGSKNGHPKGPRRQVYPDGSVDPQAVTFYVTNNDLAWPNTFPVPRYGTCMFTTAF
jgi:ribonucleotide monophosphatase NagD (HAD superfamily)